MAAEAYPPWVTVERYCTEEVQGSSTSVGDPKTLVAARTTAGLSVSVSLRLAAPPEGSRVCVQLPWLSCARVLAAHGDSVLIQAEGITSRWTDHFVYNAGDAAADPPRPPSLSLLPPFVRVGEEEYGERRTLLCFDDTGILRRGADELVVAELNMRREEEPELVLLRSGEWCVVKRPPIRRFDDGEGGNNLVFSSWRNDTVVPFGDKLCWVDLRHGIIFSDVLNQAPKLRYLPLPAEPCSGSASSCRNVCVTAGGTAMKFVSIYPQCCCCGAGPTNCAHSRQACTVRTWTLRMDDMVWVMDGKIDATQLWSLHGYKRAIPRVRLDHPVVSMEEPHVVSFEVCERHHVEDGDGTVWMIMVDTRSKSLRSVFRYPKERRYIDHQLVCPSKVSEYFNSARAQPMQPSMITSKSCMEINEKRTNNNAESKAASHEVTILDALLEIPGLAPDYMRKPYCVLSHDNSGSRFRSLMALPNGSEDGLCVDGDKGM